MPLILARELGSPEIQAIRKEVLAQATGTVLEIGSGLGYNFPFYPHIDKLYAVEPIEALITRSKEKMSTVPFAVEFLNTGAENIPLPDHCIDTVVSTWTLCSVANLSQTLSEIKRILKPTGVFIFVDHGASPRYFVRFIQTIWTLLMRHFTGNCHHNRHISDALTKAGFTIEHITCSAEPRSILIYNYEGIARA